MSFDWQWAMPGEDWQQQGSFLSGATPPVDGPDGGIQVSLGCINRDWLPLLIGCVAQLRNPSTWPTLDDSGLALVLSRVDRLRQMLTQFGACVNPVVNVTFDSQCAFTLHFADGTTSPITDWAGNFPGCVRENIPVPVPPNPRGDVMQQHACNIAGFLARELLQTSIAQMESYLGTSNEQARYAITLAGALSVPFPITFAFSQAAYQVYQDVVAQLSSQVSFVATDPVFLSDMTCAIYNAIAAVGYVDATNFAAAQANLHAISYTYAWAPNAVGNEWGNMGLTNMQQLQNVGGIDDVDCTSCGSFCHQFDFTVGTEGWSVLSGSGGAWVSGQGFVSTLNAGRDELVIEIPLSGTLNIIHEDVDFCTSGVGGAFDDRKYVFPGGIGPVGISLAAWPCPGGTHSSTGTISTSPTAAIIVLRNSTAAGGIVLRSAQISGHGPDPFGVPGCTY